MPLAGLPLPVRFEAGAEIARGRAHGRCEVGRAGCLGRDSQTHHRRARGMGGRRRAGLSVNRPSNLVRACTACHGWIEANPTEADRLGLLHPGDSADPVWLRTLYGEGWWQLTDEGDYGWVHDHDVAGPTG